MGSLQCVILWNTLANSKAKRVVRQQVRQHRSVHTESILVVLQIAGEWETVWLRELRLFMILTEVRQTRTEVSYEQNHVKHTKSLIDFYFAALAQFPWLQWLSSSLIYYHSVLSCSGEIHISILTTFFMKSLLHTNNGQKLLAWVFRFVLDFCLFVCFGTEATVPSVQHTRTSPCGRIVTVPQKHKSDTVSHRHPTNYNDPSPLVSFCSVLQWRIFTCPVTD